MEACGTAHDWGRRCQTHGLVVRLLPVQYVRPYVRRNKTDRTDTEAMLEADRCAGVSPVPVKTPAPLAPVTQSVPSARAKAVTSSWPCCA